jgi:amidase
MQDYKATTASTEEPIIETMALEDAKLSSDAASFRPTESNVTAYELWQLHRIKTEYRQQYLDLLNDSIKISGTGRPIDAIISPVAAYAAPPHGMNKHVLFAYTSLLEADCVQKR